MLTLASALPVVLGTLAAASGGTPAIPRDLAELEAHKRAERDRIVERIDEAQAELEALPRGDDILRRRKMQRVARDEAALRFIDGLLERLASLSDHPNAWADLVREPVGIQDGEYLALLRHSLELPELQRVLAGLGPLSVRVRSHDDPTLATFFADSLAARGRTLGLVKNGGEDTRGVFACDLELELVTAPRTPSALWQNARAVAWVRVLAPDGTPRRTFQVSRAGLNVSATVAKSQAVDALADVVLARWAKLVLERAAKVEGAL